MESDFDDILSSLGLGKWNFYHYSMFGLGAFAVPCFILAGVFVTPNQSFECQIPSKVEEQFSRDQCLIETSSLLPLLSPAHNLSLVSNYSDIIKCTSWKYEGNFTNTLTSEFNLVCDMAYLRPTFQTVYMSGQFLGTIFNGFLADRFGRRMLISISSFLMVGSVIVTTLVNNLTFILLLRFFSGLMSYPFLQTGYILSMEICEVKRRSMVGVLLAVPWAVGTIWFGILGYWIRDWRWLLRATLAPIIIFIVGLSYFDESPRWLIVNGKHRAALIVIKKAAQWNNASIPDDDVLHIQMKKIQKMSYAKKNESADADSYKVKLKNWCNQFIILYRTPEIRRRSLLLFVVFIVSSTVFYGLSLNGVNFELNLYMYMVVGGLSEMPAYILPVPVVSKFGRVRPTAICYLVCGMTILTLAFIPSDLKLIVIILAMIGKFCISAAYQVVYLMASELFPTEVRMQGLGMSAFVSTIGTLSTPYITDLVGQYYIWLPSVIFGGLSLVGALFTIFIPETLDKHLHETVEQLELEKKTRKIRKDNTRYGDLELS